MKRAHHHWAAGALGAAVVAAVLLYVRRSKAASSPSSAPSPHDAEQPMPAGAPPLPPDWQTFNGARPEIRGWPENTILALPGLVQHTTPAIRAKLLDVAASLEIPVDTLAVVIESESGWDPAALNPLPAAGLVQLTVGANLPGFDAKEKIHAVATWDAARQLEEVVLPLWTRYGQAGKTPTPGHMYMLNFLPADAGKGPDFVLADAREEPPPESDTSPEAKEKRRRRRYYDLNKGFDVQRRRFFTVSDVHRVAASVAARAKGVRIAVDGTLFTPSSPAAAPRPAPAAPRPAPAAPSAASSATAAHSLVDVVDATAPSSPAASSSTPATPAAAPRPGAVSLESKVGGWLLAAVRDGREAVPHFVEVPWEDLVVEVSADALQAEVAGYGLLRLPVSWAEVLEICKLRGLVPLVPELADAVWKAARAKLPVQPRGKWNTPADQKDTSRRMSTLEFTVAHSHFLDEQIAIAGLGLDEIRADVGKDWVLSPRLALPDNAGRAETYGWRFPTGGMVQRLRDSGKTPHDRNHYDYSQMFRAVKRYARTATDKVDLLDRYAAKGLPVSILNL